MKGRGQDDCKRAKDDKIISNIDEILGGKRHKMIVEEENFLQTFDAVKEEFLFLEKVDLIDYWNLENGWTDKKR